MDGGNTLGMDNKQACFAARAAVFGFGGRGFSPPK